MNTVSPIKVNNVKQHLLENKSYTQAMLESGYDKTTTLRGAANKVIQEALTQINAEFEKKITTEFVLSKLLTELETAHKSADRIKCIELLGKFKALWTERVQSDVTYTQQEQSILRRYGLTQ